MARVLLLNGPNLNLLGSREPELYGTDTLAIIEERLRKMAGESGHEVTAFQSNAEHELIERIHAAPQAGIKFLIFNPGAFSHTSIALRDALLGVRLPYFSDIASGCIVGFGPLGYDLAMRAVIRKLQT
jgi:3-dehydroquinate dehydratase-2